MELIEATLKNIGLNRELFVCLKAAAGSNLSWPILSDLENLYNEREEFRTSNAEWDQMVQDDPVQPTQADIEWFLNNEAQLKKLAEEESQILVENWDEWWQDNRLRYAAVGLAGLYDEESETEPIIDLRFRMRKHHELRVQDMQKKFEDWENSVWRVLTAKN